MKQVSLYVGGVRYIIEECEGRAEIRREDQGRGVAHPSATAYVRHHGLDVPISLKVEKTE